MATTLYLSDALKQKQHLISVTKKNNQSERGTNNDDLDRLSHLTHKADTHKYVHHDHTRTHCLNS